MKLLLDTHVLIWWDANPARLSKQASECIEDFNNELFLSVASIWEMQIKIGTGKLRLRSPLKALLDAQQRTNRLQIMSVLIDHAFALDRLPSIHKDPFDRMLVAQAMTENMSIVSNDALLANYPVSIIW